MPWRYITIGFPLDSSASSQKLSFFPLDSSTKHPGRRCLYRKMSMYSYNVTEMNFGTSKVKKSLPNSNSDTWLRTEVEVPRSVKTLALRVIEIDPKWTQD